MATNNFYGQEMRWATNGVTCTAFGLLSLIQTIDTERQAALATWPNQLGNTAIVTYYDKKTRGTFTYIPSNTSTADGNLVTSGLEPQVGTAIVQVTDSIDTSNYVNATNYKVSSVTERRTSTGVLEVVCTLEAWDGVA